jgi:hypothetical protein
VTQSAVLDGGADGSIVISLTNFLTLVTCRLREETLETSFSSSLEESVAYVSVTDIRTIFGGFEYWTGFDKNGAESLVWFLCSVNLTG